MIPFIHNYCDRWCERCNMTGECGVYERTSRLTDEQNDPNNPEFWKVVADSLHETFVMIQEKMQEHGISPMTEEEEAQYEERSKQKDAALKEEPLSILSLEYSVTISPFLKNVLENEFTDRVEVVVNLGLDEKKDEKLRLLNDCNEIIQWYRFFIHAKVTRALSGFYDVIDEVEEESMYDVNGSAKIAIIATERSLYAWRKLYELFPDQEDEILNFMIMLQKIIRLLKHRFPQAENFIRPGFDE